MMPESFIPSSYLSYDEYAWQMFGTSHSRMFQPVINMLHDLRVIFPYIIETRGINKDYTAGRVIGIGNGNMLNLSRARLQVMTDGRGSSAGRSIDKLSPGMRRLKSSRQKILRYFSRLQLGPER